MDIDITAVILATIAQFTMSLIWYGPFFGDTWGVIHGFDKLSLKEKRVMQAKMLPFYAFLLIFIAMTTITLNVLINSLLEVSPYVLATICWIGFVVPTQVTAVVFGGTKLKWVAAKTAIMAGGSIAGLLLAATIFDIML